MKYTSHAILIAATLLLLPVSASAIMWPEAVTHTSDIAIAEPGNYEPSGLVHHRPSNKMFVVSDDGKVTRMNLDGSNQETDYPRRNGIGRDFEGITIVDQQSSKLYIALEHPDSILEYDWETKQFAEKKWTLTNVLTGANNLGLEGLTFVPNRFLSDDMQSQSGGLFYAGIQRTPVAGGSEHDDYLMYAFDIDLTTSERVVAWYGIPVPAGTPRFDISDLSFNTDTGLLYVLYDGPNRLIEMTPDGVVVNDFNNIPEADQEGIVVLTSYPSTAAKVYLASDTRKRVSRYSGYAMSYYDGDQDGADFIADCNDDDETVDEEQTFYEDRDGDGLGSNIGAIFCSTIPPLGYVMNTEDDNDQIPFDERDTMNLIADGEMEWLNMDSWSAWGAPNELAKTGEHAVSGEQSLYIDARNASAGVQQVTIPTRAGRTYTVSFMYKFDSQGTNRSRIRPQLNIKDISKGDFEGVYQNLFIGDGQWREYERTFTVPEHATNDLRLFITMRDGQAWIDDVRVEDTPGSTVPMGLINDSDMEQTGTGHWGMWGHPAVIAKDDTTSVSGAQSLYIDARNVSGGAKQVNIPTRAGRTYTVSFMYKFDSQGTNRSRIRPQLNIKDISKGDFEGVYQNLFIGDGQWMRYERTFTVPDEATKDLRLFITMRDGQAWIDDVVVELQ